MATTSRLTYQSDEVLGLGRNKVRNLEIDAGNALISSTVARCVFKRRDADKELVTQNTERPKVDIGIVVPAFHHLRRQIV